MRQTKKKQHATLVELEREIVREFSTYRQGLTRHRDVVNRALAISQDSNLHKYPHRTVGIIKRVTGLLPHVASIGDMDEKIETLQLIRELNTSLRRWREAGFPIAWYEENRELLNRLRSRWDRWCCTKHYSIFPPEGIRNILGVSKRTDYLTIVKKLLKESRLESDVLMTVIALRQQ